MDFQPEFARLSRSAVLVHLRRVDDEPDVRDALVHEEKLARGGACLDIGSAPATLKQLSQMRQPRGELCLTSGDTPAHRHVSRETDP